MLGAAIETTTRPMLGVGDSPSEPELVHGRRGDFADVEGSQFGKGDATSEGFTRLLEQVD